VAYTRFPSTSVTDFPTTSKVNFPTTLDHNFPTTSITNFPNSASGTTQLWTLISSVTVLRAWQSDFGVTMGGTPLASGTTPPAVTLTGSAVGYVAFRMEIQTTGGLGAGTFRYGAQNTGATSTTWIEQNVTLPGGGAYAAIGALTGITINFPAATYTNDNVYQGTCSAWTDQKNSVAASQGTAASQPLIILPASGSGLIRGDGSNDVLRDAVIDIPAPGTTPTFVWAVLTQRNWVASKSLWNCGTTGFNVCLTPPGAGASPQLVIYNGASIPPANSGAVVGTPTRLEAYYNNGTSDYLKAGSTTTTGTAIGAADPTAGFNMFALSNGTSAAAIDIYALLICSGLPNSTELSALSSAAQTLYPGVAV
jgi:hypothetical protein